MWQILIPTGDINLNSCLSVVTLNEPIKHYKFVFDVCTSERVYHLAADTEEERSDWVSTLKDLLFNPQQKVSWNSWIMLALKLLFRMEWAWIFSHSK